MLPFVYKCMNVNLHRVLKIEFEITHIFVSKQVTVQTNIFMPLFLYKCAFMNLLRVLKIEIEIISIYVPK